jgi:hypothetical protein
MSKISLVLLISLVSFTTNPNAVAQDSLQEYKNDSSGAGGILCLWSTYITLHAGLEVCGFGDEPVARALKDAISRYDEFIVKNSSQRLNHSALATEKSRIRLDALRQVPQASATLTEACNSKMLTDLRQTDLTELKRQVDRHLAIPREPVMNPCM